MNDYDTLRMRLGGLLEKWEAEYESILSRTNHPVVPDPDQFQYGRKVARLGMLSDAISDLSNVLETVEIARQHQEALLQELIGVATS